MCFMFFIIYLPQVKVRDCYLSFKFFLLFHFITAVYVLHVSDVGAYVGGFRRTAKIALHRAIGTDFQRDPRTYCNPHSRITSSMPRKEENQTSDALTPRLTAGSAALNDLCPGADQSMSRNSNSERTQLESC
uniref:Uncharacterized protein n=1 Tax=Myotis myotis TaxID=51298 RepID=A0A7J8AN52_MYOMY|nr:hypothetical protein mMyoMyo1_008155 [Myotis myotis]